MTVKELKPLQTHVPADLKKRLEKLAQAEERSVASYVRRVLEEHVKGKG